MLLTGGEGTLSIWRQGTSGDEAIYSILHYLTTIYILQVTYVR